MHLSPLESLFLFTLGISKWLVLKIISRKSKYFLIAFQEQFIDYDIFAPLSPWLRYRVQHLPMHDNDQLIDWLIDWLTDWLTDCPSFEHYLILIYNQGAKQAVARTLWIYHSAWWGIQDMLCIVLCLKGLGHAILGNFSTDQMVTE